jgi:hypothetical protein
LPLADYQFIELYNGIDLTNFDCGDADITEWLRDDSINYQSEKMANTYLFVDGGLIIAYFCISNDCLNDEGEDRGYTNRIWNRFHRKTDLPNTKRIRSYPAVKIGRLGVCLEQQKTGIAYELMDFIKGFSVLNHKPACRLLLLDAYNKPRQVNYYLANGFQFLLDSDEASGKRIMYYDLHKLE